MRIVRGMLGVSLWQSSCREAKEAFGLFLSDHRVSWVLRPSAHYQLTHTHTSLLSHGWTGDRWVGSIWSIPRVLCGCSSTCRNNMNSGQKDLHDSVLIRHIPDFLALSSLKSIFLCYGNWKNQKTRLFSSVSTVLRGHRIKNVLCNLTGESKTMSNHRQEGFIQMVTVREKRGFHAITTHETVCGSQIIRIIMQCIFMQLQKTSRSLDSLLTPRVSV